MIDTVLGKWRAREDSVESTPRQLADFMQESIRTGAIPPGSRLPSSQELAALWGVGVCSVQKAMVDLRVAGLIDRQPRRGTFVRAERKMMEIAILVGVNLSDESSYYARTLVKALQEELGARDWHGIVYDRLNRMDGEEEGLSPIMRRLMGDVRSGIVDGAFVVAMSTRKSDELRSALRLPDVRLSQIERDSDVMNDYYRMAYDMVARAAQLGLTELLCMGAAPRSPEFEGFRNAAEAHRLPPPRIEPFVSFDQPGMEQTVYEQTLRLLDEWGPDSGGPRGMLVLDDIAMRAVGLALVRRNISVPDRLVVMTHANEGIPIHYGVPVLRYELHPRENASTAVDLLERKMRGEMLPRLPILLSGNFVEEKPAV